MKKITIKKAPITLKKQKEKVAQKEPIDLVYFTNDVVKNTDKWKQTNIEAVGDIIAATYNGLAKDEDPKNNPEFSMQFIYDEYHKHIGVIRNELTYSFLDMCYEMLLAYEEMIYEGVSLATKSIVDNLIIDTSTDIHRNYIPYITFNSNDDINYGNSFGIDIVGFFKETKVLDDILTRIILTPFISENNNVFNSWKGLFITRAISSLKLIYFECVINWMVENQDTLNDICDTSKVHADLKAAIETAFMLSTDILGNIFAYIVKLGHSIRQIGLGDGEAAEFLNETRTVLGLSEE